MLVQGYGAAFAIVVASVLVGRAICVLCGGSRRWSAAPLVGFAALMILASVAIDLPGRAVTSASLCGALVIASAGLLLKRGAQVITAGDLVVLGVSLAAASIPFIANARVGVPGPPLDGDMAIHLLISEALRSPSMAHYYPIPAGYPLGPHSLVATLGTALDLPLDMVFTGLLVAVVCLTGLVAADVLRREALWRRAIVGVLCAFTYLVAAYYGEGSFKEPIIAGLLLAFVLALEQVRDRWGESSPLTRAAGLVPPLLLGSGALYSYSYPGAAWFGGTLGLWLAAELVVRPSRIRTVISWRRIRTAVPYATGLIVVGLVVLLPIVKLLQSTYQAIGVSPSGTANFATSNLGNLVRPLSPFEALGAWTSQDFRGAEPTFHHGEEAMLALIVLAIGLVWSLRRRQVVLAAAVASAWAIALYTHHTQSPYLTAKAFVIAAPVSLALGLRALMTRPGRSRQLDGAVLAGALAFCGLVGYSSYLTLRSESIQAPEPARELAAFHRIIGRHPVLFLGVDDFAAWELRDAPVHSVGSAWSVSVRGLATHIEKEFGGMAMDFDSMSASSLDKVGYVITTNTPDASQPPSNFRLLERLKLYELWQREGPTTPRYLIEPPGSPGAVFDCTTPAGRKLAARRGTASVMTQPVEIPGMPLAAGQTRVFSIRLPKGEWELSAEYVSPFELHFRSEGTKWTMPAYLGRNGPWFAVGRVTGLGTYAPVLIWVTATRPSPVTGSSPDAVSLYDMAATAVPDTRRTVPIRRACGQYVDYFRLKPAQHGR